MKFEKTDYEKRLRDYLNSDIDQMYKNMLLNLFPELAESEDERVRKALIKLVKKVGEGYENVIDGVSIENAISWLEKQGEQKPTDKVEIKFKVGDWLVHKDMVGVICCITQIHAPHYYLTNNNSFIKFGEEDNYRPWTIQDAKNGDVLVNDFHLIFILKEIKNNTFVSHCSVIERGNDVITNSIAEREVGDSELVKVYPATQEQRSKLFSKMAEEGYEWDAENIELKKIEQTPVIEMKTPKESLSIDSDTYNKIVGECVYGEQKHAWSEEDETGLADTMWAVKQARTIAKDENDMGNLWYAERWLKSLKDRYTWKPSDEQITVLHDVATYIYNSIYPNQKDVLVNLYLQLKKLREE